MFIKNRTQEGRFVPISENSKLSPGPRAEEEKFVLLTTQRSGSTYVRLWLNSHPKVRCHSEIFLRKYPAADGFKAFCEANKRRKILYHIFGQQKLSRSPYNIVMRLLIRRFLDALYFDPGFSAPWTDMTTDAWIEYQPPHDADKVKYIGFQVMYDQLDDYYELQKWIGDPKVSVVHLIRWNVLKLLISKIVAEKTGQYHFARRGEKAKVYLEPTSILAQLDEIARRRERMRKRFSNSNPYVEISYERFFSDYIAESENLFQFLGIDKTEMRFPKFLKKLNPDSLHDLIENYEEITVLLNGTPYGQFL